MSIAVMTEVWAKSPAHGNRLLLLLAMADFANDEGVAWPSVESLALKTRNDRRTVQRQLRLLEEEGLIEVVAEATNRDPARYQLHPQGRQNAASARGGITDPQGRQKEPLGAAPAPPNPSGPVRDPSSSHSQENGGGDGFMQVQEPPEPSPLFDEPSEADRQINEVWAHYVERSTPVNAELSPARKRMLRSALKEATVEECKLAIDGNRLSAWHRERGKHNLSDIFRPGRDGNLRRQLDRFISDAQRGGANLPTLSSPTMSGLAREMKEAVRRMAGSESEATIASGKEAVQWLEERGVEVHFNNEGWPTFTERDDG